MDDDWEEYDPSRGTFLEHMIAGSIAGVVEHVAMFPVDTYKVSLMQASSAIRREARLCTSLRLSCRMVQMGGVAVASLDCF